ncbi:hypothetical protein SAMN00120144_0956 [Hymenobacter roseosalivarius DSM 11622]|uniref:Glycosyltransferase RgtA/B/C/D-like domain-containing protein n=1 Tax=Hymenobacter roseosalivarius DSM 11622 TaxID=645990 RepID=A0A1W1V8S3_9BACT|nr:hypothetical protein [Hymenobacter roseosalivarius]SMB89590.1 hypothetical protein SAMN00120144_0956 [Hymenobacter roseosalivarius DSM 11622]
MELKDLLLTPIYLGVFYAIAFGVRKRFTNVLTKKYFIPALSVKFLGAIALGLIYQFYYKGGDTFNYFNHTKIVYQAFWDSPSSGIKLLFSHGEYDPNTASYAARMEWYDAPKEFTVIKIAVWCALLCFNTYTIIALMFATISFSGMWAMFVTLIKVRPSIYKSLAISVFFIPSVFFWGSGLMKDSICLGALGWVFFAFYRGAIEKKHVTASAIIGFIAAYTIFTIKVYILLCFLPPALLWVFNENSQKIRNPLVRTLAKPLFLIAGVLIAGFAATTLTAGDDQYDVTKIGERSKITADYLYSVSVKEGGSAYHIGELDGTLSGMIKLAPQAIIVSLFRPFLWEARNPVMILSAIEALYFLIFTIRIFYKSGVIKTLTTISRSPVLVLCFVFSLVFAIAIGTSTSNFGTLVRYKIPLIPFYVAGLYILQDISTAATRSKRKIIRATSIRTQVATPR